MGSIDFQAMSLAGKRKALAIVAAKMDPMDPVIGLNFSTNSSLSQLYWNSDFANDNFHYIKPDYKFT